MWNNSSSHLMNKLFFLDKYVGRIVMLSFFLPLRIQVFIIIGICVFWGIRDLVLQKEEQKRKAIFQALILGSIYIMYLLYLPFTKGIYLKSLLFILEQKASLLLVPLAFAFISKRTKKTLLGQLHFFVIGTLLSSLIGNLMFLYDYIFLKSRLNITAPEHVYYRRAFEAVTNLHPTYMGMYLSFSAAILLFNNEKKYKLNNFLLATILTLLFVFILALMPKTPLLALGGVIIYYCWRYHNQPKKWILPVSTMLLAIAIAYSSIPSSRERLMEMKGLTANNHAQHPNENSINMRQIIWYIDTHLWQQHWLTGTGPGQLEYALAKQYYGLSMLLKTPLNYYNTHNEYLNIWLSFGVIGFILFVFILLYQLRFALKGKDPLYISLLIILLICFTTENILGRQYGILFYSLFTSLFFFIMPKHSKLI